MAFLEKPAFIALVDFDAAQKKVTTLLKKRHWRDFSVVSTSPDGGTSRNAAEIFYVPFWFFAYDIYSHEAGKTKVLSSGHGALNAFSNELDENIAPLGQEQNLKKSNDIERKQAHVVAQRVSEDEAREVVSVRLSSQNDTSKENVILSGQQMAFVPIWVLDVEVGNQKISLRMNAVNGEILNKDAVPTKEKGFSDLTNEMLSELSTPQGWIKYSGKALTGIVTLFSESRNGTRGKLNMRDIQVLAVAAIVVILVLLIFTR